MLDIDLHELGVVKIASPCPMKWSQMEGDGRVRHCQQCKLNVFNFAELSTEEARQLLRQRAEGGRICARLFVRFDGTVLTKDCPRFLRYGWLRARKLLPAASGVSLIAVLFLAAVIGVMSLFADNLRLLMGATSGDLIGVDAVVVQHAPPLPIASTISTGPSCGLKRPGTHR